MPATLKDIAKELGVSVSTVSYAINGGPRTVGDEIKTRVLAAAKAMDYRPNTVARALITRRTHTIGIIPTETHRNMTRSPYFQGCLEGVVNEAEVLLQDVLLYTRYDQSNADRFLSTILDGRVDGVIFLAPKNDSPVVEWLENRLPAIVVSGNGERNTPSLTIDNFGGVESALDHLTSLGHRRIGTIHGPRRLEDGEERLDAFRKFMAVKGLPVPEEWILDGDFTPKGGYAAGKALLQQDDRPTALFCANDESAIGFMRAANEAGVKIPADISLVSFDDTPTAELSFPQLTTVKQPLARIGATALRNLVSLIEGKEIPSLQSFDTDLVIRKSTSRPKEDS